METLEGAHGPRVRADKLAFGATLIVLGALLTLDQLGWTSFGGLRLLWPLLLLGLGLGRLLSPLRRDNGLWLLGLGVILLLHYYVAPWHQLWPLLLVLCGVSMLLRGPGGHARGGPASVHVRWHA